MSTHHRCRRRARYERRPTANVFGILSLVLGCMAVVLLFAPCVWYLGGVVAGLGILLGFLGLFHARIATAAVGLFLSILSLYPYFLLLHALTSATRR